MVITRHLAFDLGAESGRAVVGTFSDGKIQMDVIHRFPTGGLKISGSSYWNVLGFFEEMLFALKKYVEIFGAQLESIGVDSWGVDYGLLDLNGKLLSIPYTYRDDRVKGMDKKIDQIMGTRKLYELTGIQMLPINTLNQIVGMIGKSDPTLYIAQNLLLIGDLFHYFFTGRKCVEYSGVSITQLYNNVKKRWDTEIFDAFNIPKSIQTAVIHSGDFVGFLDNNIRKQAGLNSVKIIAPAVHDTASAFAAVPAAQSENWACLSSGTWSVIGTELDHQIINETAYRLNISNSGGILGRSLFLKNVMGLWIIQQCKIEWNVADPNLDYEKIVQFAEEAEPFTAFIDPDDMCFFNPSSMLEAIQVYLKHTCQKSIDMQNIGSVARIVYESLAMKYRYVLEKIEIAANKKFDSLYVIGGGSKNRMLNQFTANAFGIPISIGNCEATTLGNLLMQCYGMGILNSIDDIRNVARRSSQVIQVNPDNPFAWDKEYGRFMKINKLIEE